MKLDEINDLKDKYKYKYEEEKDAKSGVYLKYINFIINETYYDVTFKQLQEEVYSAIKLKRERAKTKEQIDINREQMIDSIDKSIDPFANAKIEKLEKENKFYRNIVTIILILILIVTGLIFIVITSWVICMIIALPFAIKRENEIGKFTFSRFAKHVGLGPFFIYKYFKFENKQ